MPELIEVESYRAAAHAVVGRVISGVHANDAWYLKGGLTAPMVTDALVGRTVTGTGRIGKLMWLTLDDASLLGLRFGMTGRIVVDGSAPIGELEYGPSRSNPEWDRFALSFRVRGRSGSLVMSDPRRLGGVELDPDLTKLGPDAATITTPQLRAALGSTSSALKSALLDQSRLAGVGNLIADETLWRTGCDPRRAAKSLSATEVAALASGLRRTIGVLTKRGGSHTGDLQSQRHRDGHCPRCAERVTRLSIGGRTTYFCASEQA